MKPLQFVAFFTLTAFVFSRNDQERLILKRVARKEFGFYFIYAIDETLSSRNALDTLYNSLNLSNRDAMIPFAFKIDMFRQALTTFVKTSGLCPSDAKLGMILSRVKTNKILFGVFYACNLFTFKDYILFVVNMNNTFGNNISNIKVNRNLEPQFCKCEKKQKNFAENCMNEESVNWRLIILIFVVTAAFLILLVFQVFKCARTRTNAVSPPI